MESLSTLIARVYQTQCSRYSSIDEQVAATEHYILNEITQWGVQVKSAPGTVTFIPVGNDLASQFEVRLLYKSNSDMWELKFGNLSANSEEGMYTWESTDRLQKALFVREVLEQYVVPALENDTLNGIEFRPYAGDGLESDRLSYFKNMYNKLAKSKYVMSQEGSTYYITKNI